VAAPAVVEAVIGASIVIVVVVVVVVVVWDARAWVCRRVRRRDDDRGFR